MCGQRYLFVSKETSQGFIQISDATKKYPNLHLDYPVYSLPILSLILFEGRSGCIYTGQLSLVKLLGQYSKTFPSVISEVWLLKSGEKSQISFSCSTELNRGNCWTKFSLEGLRPRSNPLLFYIPFLTREAKKRYPTRSGGDLLCRPCIGKRVPRPFRRGNMHWTAPSWIKRKLKPFA